MERELFDWTGWDGEPLCMTFYDVTLKVPVGKYPAGTKFDSATIVQPEDKTTSGILQFNDRDETNPDNSFNYCQLKLMGEYKLHYRVGEIISE